MQKGTYQVTVFLYKLIMKIRFLYVMKQRGETSVSVKILQMEHDRGAFSNSINVLCFYLAGVTIIQIKIFLRVKGNTIN